jgi:hypothetical protein
VVNHRHILPNYIVYGRTYMEELTALYARIYADRQKERKPSLGWECL